MKTIIRQIYKSWFGGYQGIIKILKWIWLEYTEDGFLRTMKEVIKDYEIYKKAKNKQYKFYREL